MKDLNDKDFDLAFKKRMTESYPEFEEESWLKMEKKLRKRERLVFYRNASIILLFLSFGLGFYLIGFKKTLKEQAVIAKKEPVQAPIKTAPSTLPIVADTQPVSTNKNNQTAGLSVAPIFKSKPLQTNPIPFKNIDSVPTPITSALPTDERVAVVTPPQEVIKPAETPITTSDPIQAITNEAKSAKVKRKIPIRLAISAGPDLNSTTALVGGKTSVAVGIGIEVGLSNKLSVQTGLNYGSKNYDASGYDYTFSNPNVQANITNIQALCKVLEIPLKASYNVSDNQSRSIDVNAGLSSYLMLKENYVFQYQPSLNRKDRVSEVNNANQHFFSVLELSATYHIKLKSKKLALGFEPYVKIPLGGIGEGNVRLKSSGVSLKLRYDLNKK